MRFVSRLKQTRPAKAVPAKNSPSSTKKDVVVNKATKIAAEVEKHAHKVASLPTSKLSEPKIKSAGNKTEAGNKNVQGQNHLPTQNQHGTGIPKPTAAVKGTKSTLRLPKPVYQSSVENYDYWSHQIEINRGLRMLEQDN